MRYHAYLLEYLQSKIMEKKPEVGKHVEKLEFSQISGENVKWCSYWGKEFGGGVRFGENCMLPLKYLEQANSQKQ